MGGCRVGGDDGVGEKGEEILFVFGRQGERGGVGHGLDWWVNGADSDWGLRGGLLPGRIDELEARVAAKLG